jgi:hypothetical protein
MIMLLRLFEKRLSCPLLLWIVSFTGTIIDVMISFVPQCFLVFAFVVDFC